MNLKIKTKTYYLLLYSVIGEEIRNSYNNGAILNTYTANTASLMTTVDTFQISGHFTYEDNWTLEEKRPDN